MASLWSVLVRGNAPTDGSGVGSGSGSGSGVDWWSAWRSQLWGSAPINWCEHDYALVPGVAEFWNTVSNAALVLAGMCAWRVCGQLRLPSRFYALALCIVVTGVASALFHATLIWIGQKSDEIAENAMLTLLFRALDHPDMALHAVAGAGGGTGASGMGWALRTALHLTCIVAGILFVTSLLVCELHMIAVIVLCVRQFVQRTTTQPDVARHVFRAAAFSAVGFGCWLVDRLACDAVGQWPQLHAWWHVAVGASCYEAFASAAVLWLRARPTPVRVRVTASRFGGFALVSADALAMSTVDAAHDHAQ